MAALFPVETHPSTMFENRSSLNWVRYQFGLRPAHTETSPAERAALVEFATDKTCLAEIGVHEGVTTRQLTQVMSKSGVYYAIDPYFPGKLGINFHQWIAQREVNGTAAGRVVWVQKTGVAAAQDVPPVDFLFIDGDHSYEGLKGDWEAWRSHLLPGAIVALHDTRGGRHACQRYMEEVICHDSEFYPVREVESLTIFERRSPPSSAH